jgi:hypothetical protein
MPIISPRARLLSATALACGSLSVGATAARAACEPDPPANADVVTCSGNVDDYDAIPGRDLTVEVVSGATMNPIPGNPNNAAISFDNNNASKFLLNQGNLNGNITGIKNKGEIAVTQSGNANFGMTVTGSGTTTVVVDPNRSFNALVSLEGASNTVDNFGTFNQGLVLSATRFDTVTNRAGAQINQTFSMSGDGRNRLDNSGTVNNGLTIDGAGTSVVINRENATINGDLSSVGTSQDWVDNYGLFNNRIIQGDGSDVTINRDGGTINGQVSQGGARDAFAMIGGLLNQDVQQGDGPDHAWIRGGLINGGVASGADEDRLL